MVVAAVAEALVVAVAAVEDCGGSGRRWLAVVAAGSEVDEGHSNSTL
jgi:hypothetical protein